MGSSRYLRYDVIVKRRDRNMIELNSIYCGDCLDIMPQIPDNSIDMILCDLPYGTTACKWDVVIPFELLWEQYKRITKDSGVVILTASQPFTSMLVTSNIKMFRYEWVWEKSKASNFLQASYMPLKAHENILVFYKKKPTFNHQYTYGKPYDASKRVSGTKYGSNTAVYNPVPNPKFRKVRTDGRRNPRSIQYFKTAENEGKFSPTQKPIALFEYLIKTYTNEGDLVLDNCAGSGTTGVACRNLSRNFILIEKEQKYYDIILGRLDA